MDTRAVKAVAVSMVILAVAFGLGFLSFCIAVFYGAVVLGKDGLTENATQVLTGWGGGIIGILGASVGYRVGHHSSTPDEKLPPQNRQG